jgi:hypothetical protein
MDIPVGYAQNSLMVLRDNDREEMAITFGTAVDPATHDSHASQIALAFGFVFPKTSYGANVTWTRVVSRVAEEGDLPSVQEAALPGTGSAAVTQFCPQNTALLVKKLTTHGGRPGRGRFFWPYVAEPDVDNTGVLNSSTLTTWATLFNNFLLALADTSHGAATPMVILHNRRKDGTLPAPYVVTGLILDSIVATQRRRLRR